MQLCLDCCYYSGLSSWYTAMIVEWWNLRSVDLFPYILCCSLSCSWHVASVSLDGVFGVKLSLFAQRGSFPGVKVPSLIWGSQVSLCSGVTGRHQSHLLQGTLQPSSTQYFYECDTLLTLSSMSQSILLKPVDSAANPGHGSIFMHTNKLI